MIRVNVVTEGYTELFVVKKPLNNYFGGSLVLDARCVCTNKDNRSNYEYRGGLSLYAHAKRDIANWLKEDSQAYVTTMFDFFRLPNDFPRYQDAMRCQDHRESVRILETAIWDDIAGDPQLCKFANRFIPYIQLHEFESLLFTDIRVLKYDYLTEHEQANIRRLYEETKHILPEDINHGAETAPSKRISGAVAYQKGDAPAEWIEVLTVDQIRNRCPHFSEWLTRLKALKEL